MRDKEGGIDTETHGGIHTNTQSKNENQSDRETHRAKVNIHIYPERYIDKRAREWQREKQI